ncbi:MAG: hypothetical protein ABI625_08280 [bacterium]
MSGSVVRALLPTNAEAARALIVDQFGGTRFEFRLLEQFDSALRGGEEDVGAVAVDPETGALCALVVYGIVAGAAGTTKIHVLAARDTRAAVYLTKTLAEDLSADGVRLLIAEVPDDPAFADMASALSELEFAEEGCVADWFEDGVGLRLMTSRLR